MSVVIGVASILFCKGFGVGMPEVCKLGWYDR